MEEFSKNIKKLIELDEREIRYETNKLLCDLSMKKRTKIDEIKTVKTKLKILNFFNHLIFNIRFVIQILLKVSKMAINF